MGMPMTQDEFHDRIEYWTSKDKSEWNHITLIAYFCKKYFEKNGVRFRLVRWKEEPGRGKESRDFAKLLELFLPENYKDLDKEYKAELKKDAIIKVYNYINWMFDFKFRSGERSVTGTQLFLSPSMMNEFERMYQSYLSKNKKKSTMEDLIIWAKKNTPDLFNRHQIEEESDINHLNRYVSQYGLDEASQEAAFLKKAKDMGIIK
jgi:hypothetical protein